MAAENNDGGAPAPALRFVMPSSAVVGLDLIATETVTLLLEILGWSVTKASTVKSLPDTPYRLVFIDDQLITGTPVGTEPKFSDWENIVIVGIPSPAAFIGSENARIFRADLPLNIAHLETIIANAS